MSPQQKTSKNSSATKLIKWCIAFVMVVVESYRSTMYFINRHIHVCKTLFPYENTLTIIFGRFNKRLSPVLHRHEQICILFSHQGIGNAIIGATLLHLRLLTHTSVENVASLFTWRAIGCLCGNLFVAATFDRSRPEAILAFASFMVGAMNLCVPW